MKNGEKTPKPKKKSSPKNPPHNVVPLALNVPEKYKNCPPDLVWAIPLAMHQETPEFKAWQRSLEAEADAAIEAERQEELRQARIKKLKIIKP